MDDVAKLISTILDVADLIKSPVSINIDMDGEVEIDFEHGRTHTKYALDEIDGVCFTLIKKVIERKQEHEGSIYFRFFFEKVKRDWNHIKSIEFRTWWDGEPYPFTALGDDWNEVCENFLSCLPSPAPVKPFSHIREDGVCVCGQDKQSLYLNSMSTEVYENCLRVLKEREESL